MLMPPAAALRASVTCQRFERHARGYAYHASAMPRLFAAFRAICATLRTLREYVTRHACSFEPLRARAALCRCREAARRACAARAAAPRQRRATCATARAVMPPAPARRCCQLPLMPCLRRRLCDAYALLLRRCRSPRFYRFMIFYLPQLFTPRHSSVLSAEARLHAAFRHPPALLPDARAGCDMLPRSCCRYADAARTPAMFEPPFRYHAAMPRDATRAMSPCAQRGAARAASCEAGHALDISLRRLRDKMPA